MTRRRWAVVLIGAAALLLLLGRLIAAVYVDYRWYAALGAESLWRARASSTLLLCGLSGLAASAFVFANLFAVRSSVVSLILPRRVGNIEIGEEVPGRYLVGAAALLSLVLGALLTIPQKRWPTLALVGIGRPFGESDPYFERDLGFFVYWLPFEQALYLWALVTLLVVSALVILLYALTPSLRWEQGTLRVSNYVRRHLVVLASILLLLLAWSYRLDAYTTLLQGSGADGGFGYADHRARIPVNAGMSILMLVSAFVVWWSGWTGQLRIAFAVIGIVLVVSVALRQLAPPLAQRFAGVTNRAARERPYEATRARYTQRAYALDRIARADSALAFPSVSAAVPVVSVWDPEALTRALARSRREEGTPAGVGWQLSPRGLLAVVPERARADEGNQGRGSWSIARFLASAADYRGEPLRVSAEGERSDEEEPLELPIVSETTYGGYLLVADSGSRLPAPSLDDALSRLAHAWDLQDFRLLFGDLPQPNPRIVTRRDARERVRRLAPFFTQASVLYPLVWADTLYWSVDLFATSATYPLSDRVAFAGQECSYLHYAATGLVNAHSGHVTLVADSPLDPVAESWMRRFPELFTRRARLPAELTNAMPPAVDAARVRAAAFARVGSRDIPLSGADIPWNDGADTMFAGADEPVFVLPARDSALAWAVPVVDESAHVIGLVIATGGGGGSQRGMYWLPSEPPATRWSTVIDELHRLPDTAAALPRDARAVRGAVRALPVGDGVIYAQPTYAWRTGGPPTLERVTLLADGAVASGRTLAAAGPTPAADRRAATPLPARSFRARVAALYEEMRSALRRGDWMAFGRAYDALGDLLRESSP